MITRLIPKSRFNRYAAAVGLAALLGLLAGLVLLRPWQTSSGGHGSSSPATADRCRLVVLVVFDQMRADYLDRWKTLWTDDGFRRLETQGTWFTNCRYPYACTETGPGHATLATGRLPSSHGIVGNVWYDREAK